MLHLNGKKIMRVHDIEMREMRLPTDTPASQIRSVHNSRFHDNSLMRGRISEALSWDGWTIGP